MTPSESIRILAMLEANSISGSAKAVLEFAREASRSQSESAKICLSILTFSRSPAESKLTQAVRSAGIESDVVCEHGRFDRGVIPQLQALIKTRRPHVI